MFNQTISANSEVIIYDDCSSDGTSEILDGYIKHKDNVTYIRANENLISRGINVTWIPLQYANHDVCAYLDGDDIWVVDNKNELQLAEMVNNPACGLVICGWHETDLSGKIIKRNIKSNSRTEYIKPFHSVVSNDFTTIQSSSMMFRKSLLGPLMFDYRLAPPVGDLLIQVACSRDNNIVELGFDSVNRIRSKGINTYIADKTKKSHFSRRNWDFRMRLMKSNLEQFSHSEMRSMTHKYFKIYLMHVFFVTDRVVYPERLKLGRQLGVMYQFYISMVTAFVKALQMLSQLRVRTKK